MSKTYTSAWILTVTFVSATSVAHTSGCVDVSDRQERLACYDHLAACVTTQDDDARLACYDQARVSERWAGGETRTDAAPEPSASAPSAAGKEAFPLPGSRRPADEPTRLVARIVEVNEGPRGLTYLTLDNGQVWRELSRSRVDFEPGAEVELRAGILGSVNLRIEGHDGYVKVRRVE